MIPLFYFVKKYSNNVLTVELNGSNIISRTDKQHTERGTGNDKGFYVREKGKNRWLYDEC